MLEKRVNSVVTMSTAKLLSSAPERNEFLNPHAFLPHAGIVAVSVVHIPALTLTPPGLEEQTHRLC